MYYNLSQAKEQYDIKRTLVRIKYLRYPLRKESQREPEKMTDRTYIAIDLKSFYASVSVWSGERNRESRRERCRKACCRLKGNSGRMRF